MVSFAKWKSGFGKSFDEIIKQAYTNYANGNYISRRNETLIMLGLLSELSDVDFDVENESDQQLLSTVRLTISGPSEDTDDVDDRKFEVVSYTELEGLYKKLLTDLNQSSQEQTSNLQAKIEACNKDIGDLRVSLEEVRNSVTGDGEVGNVILAQFPKMEESVYDVANQLGPELSDIKRRLDTVESSITSAEGELSGSLSSIESEQRRFQENLVLLQADVATFKRISDDANAYYTRLKDLIVSRLEEWADNAAEVATNAVTQDQLSVGIRESTEQLRDTFQELNELKPLIQSAYAVIATYANFQTYIDQKFAEISNRITVSDIVTNAMSVIVPTVTAGIGKEKPKRKL